MNVMSMDIEVAGMELRKVVLGHQGVEGLA